MLVIAQQNQKLGL